MYGQGYPPGYPGMHPQAHMGMMRPGMPMHPMQQMAMQAHQQQQAMHAQSMQAHHSQSQQQQQHPHGNNNPQATNPNQAQQNTQAQHPPNSQTPPVQSQNGQQMNNISSNNPSSNPPAQSPRNILANTSPMHHSQMNNQSLQNQTQISKTGNTTSTTQDFTPLAELHKKNNDNMLHKSYYDPGYPGELNEWSVLDYFCQPPNPFFDKSSNNAIIQQQHIHMAKLRDMKGIEYQVLHAQPPIMFIVQKCERFSPDKLKPLANYYVIDRKVYQAPDLASVLTSRLTSTLSHLKSAYGKVLDKSKYHPSIGYWWKHDELAETKQYERDQDTQKNANAFERYTTGSLLNKLQQGIAAKRDKRPESSSLANQTQTNVNNSEQNNPPTKRRKIDKVTTVVPDK